MFLQNVSFLSLLRLEALGGQQCFAAPAILLFARKAANTYGDFRLALSGFWYVAVLVSRRLSVLRQKAELYIFTCTAIDIQSYVSPFLP